MTDMPTSGAAAADAVPSHLSAGTIIAMIGFLITMYYHHTGMQTLQKMTSFSAKRVLYRLIVSLAPAICFINFLAVTSPPMHELCALVQHIIVALVMAAFMELLLLLCYRTSLAQQSGAATSEAEMPGIANVLQLCEQSFSTCTLCGGVEPSAYLQGIHDVLVKQPEIDFWASPPVGCCFACCPSLPCGQRQRPTARLVVLLRRAVCFYALGSVAGPTAELWVAGAPGMAMHRPRVRQAVELLELAVTLTALYSLFITYRLSKAPLHAYHTTLKFAAVKVLVFAIPLQRVALTRLLGEGEGLWWLHVLTCAESPLLARLLWSAFPISELPSATGRANDSDDEATRLVP